MRTSLLFLLLLLMIGVRSGQAEPSKPAEEILTAAKARASAEGKALFVHFGASWCGWCKRLEDFLASDEVKPIFEKYFVDVKLVVRENAQNKNLENPGADAVLKKVGGPAGLPFHAFVDAQGKVIVNSNRPPNGNNIGHPVKPEEIDWFMKMIEKAAPSITETELKTVRGRLVDQPR